MPLRAIAYVSDASLALSNAGLDALVEDAVRFNAVAGVTGVLLFDGGRFLQYFEGPEDGVHAVYERIVQARSHHQIRELNRGRVPQRFFPYWSMRWLGVEPALTQRLVDGEWAGFVHAVNGGPAVESALGQLSELVVHRMEPFGELPVAR